MINWELLSKKELEIIHEIAKRTVNIDNPQVTLVDVEMWIGAAHITTGLKLKELLVAKNSDFFHDVYGIAGHLNQITGKLEDNFIPRYSV